MKTTEIKQLIASMNEAELRYFTTLTTESARVLFLQFIKQLRKV